MLVCHPKFIHDDIRNQPDISTNWDADAEKKSYSQEKHKKHPATDKIQVT